MNETFLFEPDIFSSVYFFYFFLYLHKYFQMRTEILPGSFLIESLKFKLFVVKYLQNIQIASYSLSCKDKCLI